MVRSETKRDILLVLKRKKIASTSLMLSARVNESSAGSRLTQNFISRSDIPELTGRIQEANPRREPRGRCEGRARGHASVSISAQTVAAQKRSRFTRVGDLLTVS